MYVPFIGPSYVARSRSINCERSINLYPEIVESNEGKSKVALIGCPGKRPWFKIPQAGIRGMWVVPGTVTGSNDRLFAVASNGLYEIFQNGTSTLRGTLRSVFGYVGLDNNQQQLMITDGSYIYIFTLSQFTYTVTGTTTPTIPPGATIISVDSADNTATVQIPPNTFVVVTSSLTNDVGNPNDPLAGATCVFLDSYLITHQAGTPKLAISDNNNGISWDGLDQAEKEGSPDEIVAVNTAHRNLIIFGQYTTEVWYDTGATTFPLAPIQGVFLEQGLAAPFSVTKMDNTLFWVGYDKKGWGIVYRMNGYTPERVSTHAIEKIINDTGSAPLINGYSYQEEGHSFLVLNAPNMGTTLVYDSATSFWHERQSINPSGVLTRDRAGFHAFAFGIHVYGDYQTADLYIGDLDYYYDGTKPIRKIRIAPHLHTDLKYTFFRAFQVDMETGVGLDGSTPTNGVAPVATLRYSNDGGYTWGSEIQVSVGLIGQKKARARWVNLGRARDRVFWFEISDPIKVNLIDAFLDAIPGIS